MHTIIPDIKEMDFKYSLDKSSKKHTCPRCGKKRLVRYVDNQTKQFVSDKYGRCDREESCGYYLKPELNTLIESPYLYGKPTQTPVKSHYLPNKIVLPTLGLQHINNLVDFLFTQFDTDKTKLVLDDYKVGTSKKWNGATIFWQIDSKQKIRSGKIIHYDPKNGKRIKEPYPRIAWVHKELDKLNKLPKNFDLKQCLYGEHLVNHPSYSNKIVAVVESEKTALIMAINYPKYIWLSCGSINGIKTTLLNPIKNKHVVLFPDKKCFDLWTQKATSLNKNGFNIQVSSLIEGLNIEKGMDLADLFNNSIETKTNKDISNHMVAKKINQPVSNILNTFVESNKPIYDTNGKPVKLTPELKYLIDKLKLENE